MTFDLERFVTAQDPVFEDVIAELANGAKTSHWMWFVFPQLAGLGTSAMSQRYALSGIEEAEAYLAHPVLGPRLLMVMSLVMAARPKSAETILGAIDAAKLHSSMTLFAVAAADPEPFVAVIDAFYGGAPDPATVKLLGG
ncbi:DUF1810 domain-containing protein [Phreatobacter oligotrophus]|jgi:uncharacterized protein (DUF1810 family)|uniref:Uncharacterized protein (DUF1810 family) n=1 Tax=Phreatobacter oligotrophus TaxID=1122261 RepID=A0A2T4YXQ3_9HYPH|nr:DUF1810 domain-containing protein [Phreatobacter oligotrophus]PTM51119.1 uncharacterized protein (DUF1810 family) [Phreatobacter oligotrophus]